MINHTLQETTSPDQEKILFNRKNFTHSFKFRNKYFNMVATPFGEGTEEPWFQLRVNSVQKAFFRRPDQLEVAVITLKLSNETISGTHLFHIMGLFNTSRNTSNYIKGIVGDSLQQIVITTGYGLIAEGLTSSGVQLFDRLVLHHQEAITVNKKAHKYYLIPKSLNTTI